VEVDELGDGEDKDTMTLNPRADVDARDLTPVVRQPV